MAREWGGVKELGPGCWWLADSVGRWRILAVARKCRPGGAFWWRVRGAFPGLTPRASGFRPYWGFAECDGRLAVERRGWGSAGAVLWQRQVQDGWTCGDGGLFDTVAGRCGGGSMRQFWGRFEDGPSLRCSGAAAHEHCHAWVT